MNRRGVMGAILATGAGLFSGFFTPGKATAAATKSRAASPDNAGTVGHSELLYNGAVMRYCRTKSLSWGPVLLAPSMEPMPPVVTVDVEGIIHLGLKQSINDVRTALTTPGRSGSYRYRGQLVAESSAVLPETVSVVEIHGDRCVLVRWRGRFEA